jgi:hypothetical protein
LPNPDRRIPAGLRCKADFASSPVDYPAMPMPERGRMIKVSAMQEVNTEKPIGMPLKLTRLPLGATQKLGQ